MSDKVEATGEAPGAKEESPAITTEELLELVRAIKFAKPNASIRNVHKEITEVLSKSKDKDGKETFGFLTTVTVNDIKRVWKKAQQQQQSSTSDGSTVATDKNQDLMERLPDGVVQLYTVGNGSIRTLAQGYTAAAAAEAAAKEQQTAQEEQAELDKYVHVFSDVPADRTGSRPHQALISFHKQKATKKETTKSNIVKIQMAASNADDEQRHPMLLYNHDRSVKTFIHHDPEYDGYEKIQKWITQDGVGGALGASGGTKAYFYYRVSKKRNGPSVISINVSELAPPQKW